MNKEEFLEVLRNTKREGIEGLIAFLEKSDFFTAPASHKYHGAYEGGLLEHSVNVYNCLKEKKETSPVFKEKLANITDDSIAIVALLHDVCKTYFYEIEMRNKKIDNKWQQVPTYVINDKIPYGHGEKSVMMVEEYIKLLPVERYAIRWHMGPYSGERDWSILSAAMEKYPLVLALFESDMEATYVLEERK